MRTIAILLAATFAASAWAQTYVKPHVRKDGTYVEGHYRSAPDSSKLNNYSSQGNYNPYTGQNGTVNPYQRPQPAFTPQSNFPRTPVCGIAANGQYVCR
jgi:hypothetical protein